MSIRTAEELEKLREVGKIVRLSLNRMTASVRSGITTAELDEIGVHVLTEYGAEAAPRKVYGFPGGVCISVNDEAVHGVPRNRVLRDGDLVKLDLVAVKDGFFADAAVTVPVGRVSTTAEALTRCAQAAFWRAMNVARAGFRTCHIGREVEREGRKQGFNVMPELGGHGVGRTIHEEPPVPNFCDGSSRARLFHGLVLAVEPIITAGKGRAVVCSDGWTVRTADHALSAHYEHTIVITNRKPLLLTA